MRRVTKKKTQEPVVKRTMHPRGEDHHKCVLSAKLVKEIRELWASGNASLGWIANEYKISRGTAADVVYRRTWKDV